MPQFDPRPFKPQTNISIINGIRNQASRDYRDRVPVATQANMSETIENIMDFKANRNEFIDALVNRIGLVIARNNNWTNKLGKFKRGMLSYGETIEEVQVGLLKAHEYDAKREYLEKDIWATEVPDVQSSFHTVNRQNFYKVSVNAVILRRAFLEEGGLSQLIQQLMDAPTTSDEWDEYLLTVNLFREYYDNGGFFKVRVPDVANVSSDSEAAKGALRAVRTMADTLPFISTHYNAAHMPVSAQADELELFVTPEFNAAIDVEALAAAFNIDRAQIASRQTVIRQQDMNIPGAQAILTSRDFFVIADTYYGTESILNPAAIQQNYFLHHHQIISASRFVPAILFTSTEDTTPIVINDPTPVSLGTITVKNGDTTLTAIPRGGVYQVSVDTVTNPTGGNEPVILELVGATSPWTTLSNTGTLTVGFNEESANITIRATAVNDDTITKDRKYSLSGDVGQLWPNPGVHSDGDANDDGTPDA